MKNTILTSITISLLIGSHALIGFATPTVSPVNGIPVGGVLSQFFENISTTPDATIINPIITGFTKIGTDITQSIKPVFISAETFITNYLKTLGTLPGDTVLHGFGSTESMISSSMTSLVKGYLSGQTVNPNAITGYDISGNMILSRDVGYWMGSIPSGIEYTNGRVNINGNIRLYGNASSKDASSANHLTTLGQINTQIGNITAALKY